MINKLFFQTHKNMNNSSNQNRLYGEQNSIANSRYVDGEELIMSCILENLVTEDVRQCCTDSDDFINMVQEGSKNTLIYSGSSIEGVRNSGDIDLMYCRSDFVIEVEQQPPFPVQDTATAQESAAKTQQSDELLNVCYARFDMDDCYPGYTKLLLTSNQRGLFVHEDITTEREGNVYLDCTKYTKYASKFIHGFTTEESHGPAVMDQFRSVEYVVCLHCPGWPSITNGFVERLSGTLCKKIPTIEMNFVLGAGCHVVPVSHPLSGFPEVEFRLSFSVIEKYLIRNWTTRQLRCYFLCKELVKEFLNGVQLEKGICSYFIKTAIFWITEHEPLEFWQQPYLQCTEHILETLMGYLAKKSCPNYFIPENLMMSTFTDAQCRPLMSIMKAIRDRLFLYSLNGATIRVCVPDFPMFHSLYTALYSLNDGEFLTDVLTNVLETNNTRFWDRKLLDYQNYANHRIYLLTTFIFALQFALNSREMKPLSRREGNSPLFACFKVYFDRHIAYQLLSTSLNMEKVKKTDEHYRQGGNKDHQSNIPQQRPTSVYQPQTPEKDPQASEQQPEGFDQQPQASFQQLQASDQQPQASDQQPQASDQQPQASDQQPQASDQQPQASDQQPQASDQQPQASDQQPQASDQQPQASDQQPQASDQQLQPSVQHQIEKFADQKDPSLNKYSPETDNDSDIQELKNEKERYVNGAESILLSSIRIPGVLDDHGLSGHVYLALFFYVTGQYEKSLDMLREAHLSSEQIPRESLKVSDLPVVICGTSTARAPEFFAEDEILCGLFERRHLHIVSFDSLVLSTYLRYRMTGDVRFLYLLVQVESELEARLWGPKDLQHRDSTWESYFYIRYRLGVLEKDTKEYAFLTKDAECSFCFGKK